MNYVLSAPIPEEQPATITPATSTTTPLTVRTKKANGEAKEKFKKDNKIVRGHVHNHMTNSLFDLFLNQKYANEIQ